MDYQKIYDNLIQRAQQAELINCYFERHHIIPKCMGGSNEESNIAKLTAREHFIAHLLLYKIYSENNKLLCAFALMRGRTKHKAINSRSYEKLRNLFSNFNSERMKGNRSKSGQHLSEITKEKIRVAREFQKPPMKGKIHSLEARLKMSMWQIGRTIPKSTRLKISLATKGENNHMYGRKRTDEEKKKISENRKGKGIGKRLKINIGGLL